MAVFAKRLAGLFGIFFNLIGTIMLVFEVMVWVPDSTRATQLLGRVWFEHDPFFFILNSHSIQLAQVIAERKLHLPAVWNPGITTILNWQSWIALLVVGVVCLLIGGLFTVLALGKKRTA